MVKILKKQFSWGHRDTGKIFGSFYWDSKTNPFHDHRLAVTNILNKYIYIWAKETKYKILNFTWLNYIVNNKQSFPRVVEIKTLSIWRIMMKTFEATKKKNSVKNIIWINLSKDSDCTADICSFDTLENLDYNIIFVISSFEL